ncbi:hypothetical protein LB572_00960 [Mesorhizobium sp. BH1-1-5]|uniref:hypothetical protein n=1 Tax=Mesorhizobium sp. BH1-1-5 TaxID=2876661 RepID=UPI001CCA8850|nr:hypothetical protein [Mesorhizobium sp. BH1-1-5]MBZ9985658.1 hypothetical protein [Mesorhizobium sp. BH1-1-5]
MISIYLNGTVSVTNGDGVVTGSGTAWAVAGVNGGMFSSAGVSVPILSVESDTSLTLAYPWPGTTATGAAYAIQRDNSDAASVVDLYDRLSRVLVTLSLVSIDPDASGTLAERDALVLSTDDEGFWFCHAEFGVAFAYYRWTGTAWEGPFDPKGEQGVPGVGVGGYGLPAGGATGQFLLKASGTDGDAEWANTVLLSPGSASGPSLAFDGDADTGIYSPDADIIGFSTAGVLAGVIDTAGRFNLGNDESISMNIVGSHPKLQVHGTDTDTTTIAQYRWQNTSTGVQHYLNHSKSATIGAHAALSNDDGIGSWIAALSDGTKFIDGISIQAVADGAQAVDSTPAAINFRTNSGGTATTIKGRLTAAGQWLFGHIASVPVGATNNQSPILQVHGLGTDAQADIYRWAASTGGATLGLAKSRGATAGTRGIVSSGDTLGSIQAFGDDGTNFPPAARIQVVVDGTPGAGDMPGRIELATTQDGSTTLNERLRIDNAGVISHRANAQVIVDANSHLHLRSYTVATVPSASVSAQMIYVSDGTSNKRLAISDGTNWRWPDGIVVS